VLALAKTAPELLLATYGKDYWGWGYEIGGALSLCYSLSTSTDKQDRQCCRALGEYAKTLALALGLGGATIEERTTWYERWEARPGGTVPELADEYMEDQEDPKDQAYTADEDEEESDEEEDDEELATSSEEEQEEEQEEEEEEAGGSPLPFLARSAAAATPLSPFTTNRPPPPAQRRRRPPRCQEAQGRDGQGVQGGQVGQGGQAAHVPPAFQDQGQGQGRPFDPALGLGSHQEDQRVVREQGAFQGAQGQEPQEAQDRGGQQAQGGPCHRWVALPFLGCSMSHMLHYRPSFRHSACLG
jgi:hypothetical protein